jgi:magnesium transporter
VHLLRDVDPAQLRELRVRDEFFWLDLEDPSDEVIDELGRVLGLHELAIEDTREFGQRPKLDAYDDQLLLVYFGAGRTAAGGPCPVEVHLHLTRSFVVTVHRSPCQQFDVMRDSLRRRPPDSEGALIYRVIDALTDSLLEVLDAVEERIDQYESEIFHRPQARDRDAMALLRRELGGLRRVLVVQRQVFERAAERVASLAEDQDEASAYLRDVGDHLWRALDETEAARDTLQGMLDTYTNEVQERLTIVATIFLPLTAITSFFGQNFSWLIDHIGSGWAFWGIGVAGLLASSIGIIVWLRRSGLINRRGAP